MNSPHVPPTDSTRSRLYGDTHPRQSKHRVNGALIDIPVSTVEIMDGMRTPWLGGGATPRVAERVLELMYSSAPYLQ